MRIGIVGNGVVGKATAHVWKGHVEEVRCYDQDIEKATHSLPEVLECDFVFVCLPTPQKEGGLSCDLTVMDNFFKSVKGERYNRPVFVIRSTVPIGTTITYQRLHALAILHNPEFLTERTALIDALTPARNIIGGHPSLERANLTELYAARFPGVPLFVCTSHESEAIKLFCNAFSAIKIAAFNEFYRLAERCGLDWTLIHKAMMAGGWIAHEHTQVPGPDGKFGFGGKCLPKDLASLIWCLEQKHLNNSVTMAAYNRNIQDRAES